MLILLSCCPTARGDVTSRWRHQIEPMADGQGKRYLILGSKTMGIDQVAARVARALGVTFTEHYSEHKGGDYLRSHDFSGEELYIQRNEDEPGYWTEPDLSAYPTIMYVIGGGDKAEEDLGKIDGLDILKREWL